MGFDFSMETDSVQDSLKKIEDTIKEITEKRDRLSRACDQYKAEFQDEISEKSVILINQIDAQLNALSEALAKFAGAIGGVVKQMDSWRTY